MFSCVCQLGPYLGAAPCWKDLTFDELVAVSRRFWECDLSRFPRPADCTVATPHTDSLHDLNFVVTGCGCSYDDLWNASRQLYWDPPQLEIVSFIIQAETKEVERRSEVLFQRLMSI